MAVGTPDVPGYVLMGCLSLAAVLGLEDILSWLLDHGERCCKQTTLCVCAWLLDKIPVCATTHKVVCAFLARRAS